MVETVHIVLDTSGSMVEDSKHHSAIYLLLSLRRFFQEGEIPVKEWLWSEELTAMETIPSIHWTGSLNSHAFQDFARDGKIILLLSDGDFPLAFTWSQKNPCYLILLGGETHSLDLPQGHLWLPQNLLGHLTYFQRKLFLERQVSH